MQYKFDIIIIGGGISGLWLLNELQSLGFNTILLEKNTLGCQQTIASQGIIHRGIKYTLTSSRRSSMNTIAHMPALWNACLRKQGPLDLSQTRVLSEHYHLWSSQNWRGSLKTFMSSQLLRSHSTRLNPTQRPRLLADHTVYQVDEKVLDIASLLSALTAPHPSRFFKIPLRQEQLLFPNGQHLQAINLRTHACSLQAQHYIFTAGEGNAALLPQIIAPPRMQRRPLHMVFVKFAAQHLDYRLFAHCLDHYAVPRITITTHQHHDGAIVWYLGGKIAEQGVTRNTQQQIQAAQHELNALFPGLTLPKAHWGSFSINRAEAAQENRQRPQHFFTHTQYNYTIAWPTKLTLVPAMVSTLIHTLSNQQLKAQKSTTPPQQLPFPQATCATPPWEHQS